MKSAVFQGKRKIVIEERKEREPNNNEVMIRVQACGVCGTDVHIYEGAEGAAKTNPPTILGHEFSGIVSAIGTDVKTVKPGDRVCVDPNDMCGECYYCRLGKAHFCENMVGIGTTVDGGFSEYCTVREKQVYKIPDSLSFVEAAMTEPVGCCLHGMDMTGISTGDTCLIVGGGTIGLIMVQLAKLSGCAVIILAEPIASKRDKAKKLGADIAFDPLAEDINEILNANSIKTINKAIECVGTKDTMKYTIDHTGKGGVAMLFGLTNPGATMDILPFELFKNEITVKASFINPYTHGRALELLGRKKLDVLSLITDEVKLDDINEIFTSEKYKGRGKIIVKP